MNKSRNEDFVKAEASFTAYKNQRLVAVCHFKSPGCYIVFATEAEGGANKSPRQVLCLSLSDAFAQAQSYLDTGAFKPE